MTSCKMFCRGKGRVVTQRRGGRTINKTSKVGGRVEVPGKWYLPEAYPFGNYKSNGHKFSFQLDPTTRKRKKMIFVPELKEGVFAGSLYSDGGIEDSTVVDDDSMITRAGQLEHAWSVAGKESQLLSGAELGKRSSELANGGNTDEDDTGSEGQHGHAEMLASGTGGPSTWASSSRHMQAAQSARYAQESALQ